MHVIYIHMCTFILTGDFHFMWECLKVLFLIFWGTPSLPGSLCNMREIISRNLVDKEAKVFSIADEFILHVFRAHFQAAICSIFGITSISSQIVHPSTQTWLDETAETIVSRALMPQSSEDPVHTFHLSFLNLGFLYVDLRNAVRWEKGPQIVRHWKDWLPRFVGTGRKNYAAEAVHLTVNLIAGFPKHISYIAVHNRTVNMSGIPGHGKPVDQMIEHYNL